MVERTVVLLPVLLMLCGVGVGASYSRFHSSLWRATVPPTSYFLLHYLLWRDTVPPTSFDYLLWRVTVPLTRLLLPYTTYYGASPCLVLP